METAINHICDTYFNSYKDPSLRFFLEHMKLEYDLVTKYSDRELLELLQNADDAGGEEVHIKLTDDSLSISNSGTPFNIENFVRLCQGSVSGKDKQYIGSKGIGFRSVWNWAEEVSIESGPVDKCISVLFSKTEAKNKLDELLKNKDIKAHIEQQLQEFRESKNAEPEYPVMKYPIYKELQGHNLTTEIKIKIQNKETKQKILDDIKSFDKYVLIFLPNIKKIQFYVDDNLVNKIEKRGIASVSIIDSTGISENFIVKTNELEDSEIIGYSKKIKLAVALPETGVLENQNLYCFFPIKNVQSPFKALLNATFCLTDNRNSLDDSKDEYKKNNRIVFKHLLNFYLQTVLEKVNDERRLEFLLPTNFYSCNSYSFPGNFDGYNSSDFFNKVLKESVFFNNQNIFMKASDSPILIKDYPAVIESVLTDKLIKYSSDENLYNYERELLLSKYKNYFSLQEENIKHEISDKVQSLSDEERIDIFKWWFDNGYTSLPKVLKDDEGNYIEDEDVPCFLSSEGIKEIPEWAISKIVIINSKDEELLLNKFSKEINDSKKPSDDNPKRLLPRLLKKTITQFNIQEQSSRQSVISPVNQAVENDYERAKEFVMWLWKIWRNKEFDSSIQKIDFVVPTRKHSVEYANKTYLGKEYNNSLGEKLFSDSKEFSALDFFEVENDEEIQQEKFLTFLGVEKLPKLVTKEFEFYIEKENSNDDKEVKLYTRNYLRKLKENYSPKSGFNSLYNVHTSLQSITNLTTILQLDDNIIFEWIFTCESIRNIIVSLKETESSYVNYKRPNSSKFDTYYPNIEKPFLCYLRFVFSNTKWISLKEKKYSPNELFLSEDSIFEQHFSLTIISEKDLKEKLEIINRKLLQPISRDVFKSFLKSLGMKTSILEFDSNKFYEILLKLPELKEQSFKTSRAIYRAVIDNYQDEDQVHSDFYNESDNKKRFFEQGEVLAKTKDGKLRYEPINNVNFSSSAVYCLSDKLFIDVPTRMGKADDFKNIFNIESPEEDYTVDIKKISNLDGDLKKDLESYLPALMTFRKNPELVDLNKLNISLAEEININGEPFNETKYTLFKQTKNNWVIYIGYENNYKKLTKDKIANCLVQVFNVFFNYPSKDFLEKVITLYFYPSEYRSSFVENELGSTQELEDVKEFIKNGVETREFVTNTICKNLGIDAQNFIDSITSINWLDTDNPDTQQEIFYFLVKNKKDLNWLNTLLEMNISFDSFHKWKIDCLWDESKKEILNCIYNNLLNEPISEKEKFKSLEYELKKRIKDEEKISSNDFFSKNHKIYFDEILSGFYSEKQFSSSVLGESFNIYYEENLEYIKSKIPADDIYRICNKQEYESLLYFVDKETKEKIDKIIELIQSEIKAETEAEAKDNNKAQSNLFAGIFDNIPESSSSLDKGEPLILGNESSGSNGLVTLKSQTKNNRKNKKQGNYAEYFVVLRLVNSLIPEVIEYLGNDYSINWVSGAAKLITKFDFDKGGYSNEETNDGAGYDIEVISSDKQKKLYIEVKSSSGNNCSFTMSSNEKKRASELDDGQIKKYRIVFVSSFNIEDENCKPEIHFIDEKVTDDLFFDSIPTEYNIVYKGLHK